MRELQGFPGFWLPKGVTSNRITPEFGKELAQRCIEECGGRRGVAIDGGAYVGTFSNHLARRFDKVLAFEPISENYECLIKNIPKNVTAYNTALYSYTGKTLISPGEKAKTYTWRILPSLTIIEGHASSGLTVDCTCIDDLELLELDFIKLDVEGIEYTVLKHSRKTLERCRPFVLIEEKLDAHRTASMFLQKIGMHEAWRMRYDVFFKWRD